jgi:hypothetical protein
MQIERIRIGKDFFVSVAGLIRSDNSLASFYDLAQEFPV